MLRRTPREADIPTASMADIAFLLVVFFLVTTVFAETRGLPFRVPPHAADPPAAAPEHALHLRIDARGRVSLDGAPTDPRALELAVVPAVLARLRGNTRQAVLVTAAPRAPYGSLVGVLDALGQAEAAARDQALLPPGGRLRVALPSLSEIDALETRFGRGLFD